MTTPSRVSLQDSMRQGAKLLGAWGAAGAASTVEALAGIGFDYVGVDMQHGLVGYSEAVRMITAIDGRGVPAIVRVPSNDPTSIGQVLDAGAAGVIVPMVSTASEAERAVAACRYPPHGVRSYGPVRAAMTTGSREPTKLEEVLCAVMVETQEGLDNLDAIAATPGIDALYVGPADLALSLGLPPAYEHDDPTHRSAIQAIQDAAARHDKLTGIHCADGAMANRRLAQGFHMVTFFNDLAALREKASDEIARAQASA